MSTLGRYVASRRRRTHRGDAVSIEEFGYLLGRGTGTQMKTRSGVTMSDRKAMGITAWSSGVRYLAESIASLPVHTYRGEFRIRSRRVNPAWLTKPDAELTRFGLMEFLGVSVINRGNAYGFKLRNPNSSQVTGVRTVHPDRVRVGVDPRDGLKLFQVDNGKVPFTSREILHITGLSCDGVMGLNPIQQHAQVLGGVAAADEYHERYFGQATHMGGVISVPQQLTPEEAIELRAEWDKFHQGLTEAHQTGVLSLGGTYNQIGINAKDAQLIEGRSYGVLEVARILRIPPHKLYELSRATFSNIEHQSIEAVMDSIRPWVVRFEAAINADLDLMQGGNFIEFQLEGMLRGDSTSRAAWYHSGINDGWMRRSEPRQLENLEPVDGLDEFLVPENMAVLGEDASLKEKTDAAGVLVRAGYDPADTLLVVGLPPIKHTGLVPVTVQSDAAAAPAAPIPPAPKKPPAPPTGGAV